MSEPTSNDAESTVLQPRLSALRLEEQGLEDERQRSIAALGTERQRIEEKYELEQQRIKLRICAVREQQNEFVLINRLPDELLSIIFLLALASQHRTSRRVNRSPTNVSQTCSRWRRVALFTPRLWSQLLIGVRYLKGGYGLHEHTFAWLEERISRVKAVPVTIVLRTGGALNDLAAPLQSAVAILSPHYARCRSLNIMVVGRQPLELLFGTGFADMPLLEYLAICQENNYAAVYHVSFTIEPHSLRSLVLKNVTLRLLTNNAVLGQLSSLRLTHASIVENLLPTYIPAEPSGVSLPAISEEPDVPRQSVEALLHAAQLEKLYISSVEIPPSSVVGKPNLALLRHLHFSLGTTQVELLNSCISLLKGLETLPLRILTISGVDVAIVPRVDDVLKILQHSVPSLETFALHYATFQAPIMLDFLASLPVLRRLDLSSATISSPFLNGLKTKKAGTVCPRLEELDLSNRLPKGGMDGYRPYDVDSLHKMIKSRCSGGPGPHTKLQKLVVKGNPPSFDSLTLASLETLVPTVIRYPGKSRRRTGPIFSCLTDDEDDADDEHFH